MRTEHFSNLGQDQPFDVIVIGGGVTGAPIYHELCRQGYRTAIIDKGDFASGTSQASGMMIWGGLLYLKQMDIFTVRKLCKARDQLLEAYPDAITNKLFRLLLPKQNRQSSWSMMMGLYLYWLLGDIERRFPKNQPHFSEQALVQRERIKTSLFFEEAFLRHSDTRYVLDWITPFDSENHVPLNYCKLVNGCFDTIQKVWRLELQDQRTNREYSVTSKAIINATGIWTDKLNEKLGIESNYRHRLSKGVYLNLPRDPTHEDALIFNMEQHDDVLTYVPWGPVAMWGPTETLSVNLAQGLKPEQEDIRFLLSTANKNLSRTIGPEDIISLRCGVRPLAIEKGFSKDVYPLELSRKYVVDQAPNHHAWSVYGGKLTSSVLLARDITKQIKELILPHLPADTQKSLPRRDEAIFPGLANPQVSATWAKEHEFCLNLEDYLRRRSNIAQWIPRMGLGRSSENVEALRTLAAVFCNGDHKAADAMLADYCNTVRHSYDELLQSL
jgi:glycerol-3-phosphate dehydrogenase